jgi:UDP-N-acetylmuramoylalanine-D-glutamate ligase
MTVEEYLRRHKPVDRRKRDDGSVIRLEARQCAYAAAKEVLLSGGGVADYRTAVALALAAAPRHGAEPKAVWRHIRRFRALTHKPPEQLELFPSRRIAEHVREYGS